MSEQGIDQAGAQYVHLSVSVPAWLKEELRSRSRACHNNVSALVSIWLEERVALQRRSGARGAQAEGLEMGRV
ncbi:MAG: hypothetical protein ACRD3M_16935, partial [Thermoanaerobaculia bacterium]